jgi:large subunit ribosomal protein L22
MSDEKRTRKEQAAGEGDENQSGAKQKREQPAREKAPPRPRRRAAETTTDTAKPPPARRDDGAVVVRARARYVRTAPRKARLVMEHIRGKSIEDARALLEHTPRAASRDVLKLLNSAVANAENNHELGADELRVERAYVDEGPTIKRFRPRALGRATRINKRTSHMTITLTTVEG